MISSGLPGSSYKLVRFVVLYCFACACDKLNNGVADKEQLHWQDDNTSLLYFPLCPFTWKGRKISAHIGPLNEFRSSSDPWQPDLWQLLYGDRLWIQLFRGVPTAEMSGQCRHVQAGFNCTLPVPETGYSCMGHGALHAFWLRTEPLAAMVKLVQYPNLGMVSAP